MAEKIPLNFYKRITKSLSRVPTVLYSTPSGRASILLNTFTNNNSNSNNYVTVSLSSTSQDNLTFLNRFPLTKKDVINLTPQKVITTEGDSFIASADIENLVTLSDPATFWEFNLPTNITTLDNITFGFTSGSQISADFGTENLSMSADTVVLTSQVPVDFTYDLSNETDTNVTLSILETVNTP